MKLSFQIIESYTKKMDTGPDTQVKQLPNSEQLIFLEVTVTSIIAIASIKRSDIQLYKIENHCVFPGRNKDGSIIHGKFAVYPYQIQEGESLIIVYPVKLVLEDSKRTITQKLLAAALNIELYPHSRAILANLDGGDLSLPEDW